MRPPYRISHTTNLTEIQSTPRPGSLESNSVREYISDADKSALPKAYGNDHPNCPYSRRWQTEMCKKQMAKRNLGHCSWPTS